MENNKHYEEKYSISFAALFKPDYYALRTTSDVFLAATVFYTDCLVFL